MSKKQGLAPLLELLQKIENDLKRARLLIEKIEGGTVKSSDSSALQDLATGLPTHDDEPNKIVEGVFDGYFMVGSDTKKYPVPMNYSSKSKLIPGDVLKLRVMEDGKLIYKLIGQAERKFIKATLTKSDDGKYTALNDEGKVYFLNQAAVTYFKGQTGDELSIIINAEGIGNFAAIEAVIPQGV